MSGAASAGETRVPARVPADSAPRFFARRRFSFFFQEKNEDADFRLRRRQTRRERRGNARNRTGRGRRAVDEASADGRAAATRVFRSGAGHAVFRRRDEAEEARGFTKYERDPATGVYHKTAGTDPNAPESFRKPSGNELLPHEDALLHGEGCSCAACRRGKK